MTTKHLLVKGKVQGVFYRATAKEVADEMKLKGWVQNTKNGNVEIVATGTEEQLERYIAWCKEGPRAARVEDVIITNVEVQAFEEFGIRK